VAADRSGDDASDGHQSKGGDGGRSAQPVSEHFEEPNHLRNTFGNNLTFLATILNTVLCTI